MPVLLSAVGNWGHDELIGIPRKNTSWRATVPSELRSESAVALSLTAHLTTVAVDTLLLTSARVDQDS